MESADNLDVTVRLPDEAPPDPAEQAILLEGARATTTAELLSGIITLQDERAQLYTEINVAFEECLSQCSAKILSSSPAAFFRASLRLSVLASQVHATAIALVERTATISEADKPPGCSEAASILEASALVKKVEALESKRRDLVNAHHSARARYEAIRIAGEHEGTPSAVEVQARKDTVAQVDRELRGVIGSLEETCSEMKSCRADLNWQAWQVSRGSAPSSLSPHSNQVSKHSSPSPSSCVQRAEEEVHAVLDRRRSPYGEGAQRRHNDAESGTDSCGLSVSSTKVADTDDLERCMSGSIFDVRLPLTWEEVAHANHMPQREIVHVPTTPSDDLVVRLASLESVTSSQQRSIVALDARVAACEAKKILDEAIAVGKEHGPLRKKYRELVQEVEKAAADSEIRLTTLSQGAHRMRAELESIRVDLQSAEIADLRKSLDEALAFGKEHERIYKKCWESVQEVAPSEIRLTSLSDSAYRLRADLESIRVDLEWQEHRTATMKDTIRATSDEPIWKSLRELQELVGLASEHRFVGHGEAKITNVGSQMMHPADPGVVRQYSAPTMHPAGHGVVRQHSAPTMQSPMTATALQTTRVPATAASAMPAGAANYIVESATPHRRMATHAPCDVGRSQSPNIVTRSRPISRSPSPDIVTRSRPAGSRSPGSDPQMTVSPDIMTRSSPAASDPRMAVSPDILTRSSPIVTPSSQPSPAVKRSPDSDPRIGSPENVVRSPPIVMPSAQSSPAVIRLSASNPRKAVSPDIVTRSPPSAPSSNLTSRQTWSPTVVSRPRSRSAEPRQPQLRKLGPIAASKAMIERRIPDVVVDVLAASSITAATPADRHQDIAIGTEKPIASPQLLTSPTTATEDLTREDSKTVSKTEKPSGQCASM